MRLSLSIQHGTPSSCQRRRQPQIQKVSAKTKNKLKRTLNKGQSSILMVKTFHRKMFCFAKLFTRPRNWLYSDSRCVQWRAFVSAALNPQALVPYISFAENDIQPLLYTTSFSHKIATQAEVFFLNSVNGHFYLKEKIRVVHYFSLQTQTLID